MLHEIQHAIQQKEGFQGGGNINSAIGMINAKKIKDADILWLEYQRIENLIKSGDSSLVPELKGIERRIGEIYDAPEDPYGVYMRLMGETEARNVQARMNMGREERMRVPPIKTEDRARNLQIRTDD